MMFLLVPFLVAFFSISAAEPLKKEEPIRLRPVGKTPEPESTSVSIVLPKNQSVVNSNQIWTQVRVDGYAIGTQSQFDRADEIVGSKLGQTIHVVVDNDPYFAINEPAIDPFTEEGWYYDTSYKFTLPMKLKPGAHLLRVFLARSYGECLKGDKMFFTTIFYVDKKTPLEFNLSQPFLTYNEPSNELYLIESKPVLLDFYLSNCDLTSDGYKVRLTIDENTTRLITSWQPYYIYGLKKGKHTIQLELIDRSGKVVPSPLNTVKREITIH